MVGYCWDAYYAQLALEYEASCEVGERRPASEWPRSTSAPKEFSTMTTTKRTTLMNIRATLRVAAAMVVVAMGTVSAQAFEPIISIGGEHRLIHRNAMTDELLATTEQTDGMFSVVTLDGYGPGSPIVHSREAEIWYVVEGTYTFHVGDKTFEGGPGTFVAVDKDVPHYFTKAAPGKLLAIFIPGGYEQFFVDWEKSALVPGPSVSDLEKVYGVSRP